MKIASFFAGAGGLDLGFEKAGFDVVWANEFDQDIWETYEKNHLRSTLDRRSIADIPSAEVPDCDGIIGGPPCQSWSAAGTLRGVHDKRGQLFFEFIRILADKQPKFFLAENVAGMLLPSNKKALENIKALFQECGYELSFQLVNASDYGVPQDRKRVFFVGYRKDLGRKFEFPNPTTPKKKATLESAIGDLKNLNALPAAWNRTNLEKCELPNHEYMSGSFSSMYMSRNRVRHWNEASFTIQAGARHAPLHPQAPKMAKVATDVHTFEAGKESLYRRLTVRECARIQTFPDDFIFHYTRIRSGYKMIGNAVPVELARVLATAIAKDLKPLKKTKSALPQNSLTADAIKERMLEIVNPA